MKILVLISLMSFSVFAETYEYKIEGMTCQGCKTMVKGSVCALPGIKACDVQIGSMKLTSEDGKTLDQTAITNALNEINKKYKEDYKIASVTKIDETAAIVPTSTPAKKEKK